MITIARLTVHDLPWRYALHIADVDSDTFHRFIEALKQHVAIHARKWNATNRCWLLRECDTAIALAKQFGLPFEYEDVEDAPPPSPPPAPLTTVEAYRALHLLPTAPPCVVSAAYRALAKQFHPDAGGGTVAMQRLNAAMEVLK